MAALPGWTTARVGGHLCDVFTPRVPHQNGCVLLYLHGVHLTPLRALPAIVEQCERQGLPVVAPGTQRSWWTDRICPEFDGTISAERHVLCNVLPWITREWGSPPPRVGLFGTGMGGQGALRLAYRHPQAFPVVAAISPAIDFHQCWAEGDEVLARMYPDAESARQDTALLQIHPLNWPRHQFFCCDPADARWHESAERLHMKLWSLGVPHQCDLVTTAGGDRVAYYNAMAGRTIGFLTEGLSPRADG
jgi:enterochelin esterase-like enzyme